MNVKHAIAALPLSLLCLSTLLLAEKVHLQEGTPVRVRLKADLASDRAEAGNRVDFEVAQGVTVGSLLVIPEGAVAWGAVQSVKKDKAIKFDIQGVRLPDLREVKLRCIREKTNNPAKDQIKIDTEFGETVGVPKGTVFTAYIDDDVWVEAAAAPPAATAPAVRPSAAPAAQLTAATPAPTPTAVAPAEVRPAAPVVVTAPPTIATPAPQPAASTPAPSPTSVAPAEVRMAAPTAVTPVTVPTPTAQPAAPVATPTLAVAPAAAATGERVTVECFSDPSGADILIDGEFYGNTPSILKILVGNHRVEIQLPGYKVFSQPLNLPAGGGIRTIRALLEKRQ